MKQFFFCQLLLCLIFTATATETKIQGKISGFDGKTIKLGTYKNFITFEKEWKTKTNIKDGGFSISIDLDQTEQVLLKIEDKETSLFIEPGKVYNIELSYDAEANQGQAFDKFLNLKFPFPQADDVNQYIKKFNKEYQKFFSLNYRKMMYKGASKETDEFTAKWKKNAESVNSPFAKDYILYTIANLEDINKTSPDVLFKSYLQNKSILYKNKEYFNFFSQFYKNDFEQLILKKESQPLLKAMMYKKDAELSRKEIMSLKKISNPALAELYLMNGLFEVYHKRKVDQESVIALLKEIQQNGITYPNQSIAGNMVEVLERFGKKQDLPDFSLKTEKGEVKSLKDFKGKPIYLGFWSTKSIPSLRELKVIQVLHEKYGDKIHFVNINLDENAATITQTKERYGYDWTFLHYGNNYEIKEQYDVRTVPTYFLLDENGKLLQAHAPGPVEIEKTFYEMTKRP